MQLSGGQRHSRRRFSSWLLDAPVPTPRGVELKEPDRVRFLCLVECLYIQLVDFLVRRDDTQYEEARQASVSHVGQLNKLWMECTE